MVALSADIWCGVELASDAVLQCLKFGVGSVFGYLEAFDAIYVSDVGESSEKVGGMAGSDALGGAKLDVLPNGEDEFHPIYEHDVSANRYALTAGQNSCWNVGLSRVRRGTVSLWGLAV